MNIYLIEATCYDPASAVEMILRWCTGPGYVTRGTDTPPSVWYEPCVETPLNFSRHVFSDGRTGGASQIGYGEIRIKNGDGIYDHLLDYGFDGRRIRLLRGEHNAAYADFEVIFTGTTDQPEIDWTSLTLRVRDRQAELNTSIQTVLYAGTNSGPQGVEGTGEDLKDRPKPLCYGFCRNAAPPNVNSSKLIHQVHDGPVQSILNVYDEALPLGTDLIGDGDMDVPASWSAGSGWSIADGLASHVSGASGNLEQSLSLTAGASQYCLSFDLTREAGTLQPAVGTLDLDDPLTSSGQYAYGFDGVSGNLLFKADADFVGSVDNVRLHFARDYPDTAALQAAAVGAGEYAVCLAEGLMRLGSTPAGEITADVRGDASGAGYVGSAPEIVERILIDKAGLTVGDLITSTFTALKTDCPAEVGIFIDSEQNILSVLDTLMNSIGGWYSFTRLGEFEVGRFTMPTGTPVSVLTELEILDKGGGLQRIAARDKSGGLPTWKVSVQYGRIWKVQSGKPVGTTEFRRSRRARLEKEYRVAASEDTSVTTVHPSAAEAEFESLLCFEGDARAEAERRLNIYKTRRDRFKISLRPEQTFSFSLGSSVRLVLDRFGLQAGKDYVVIGVTDNLETGLTELDVYG